MKDKVEQEVFQSGDAIDLEIGVSASDQLEDCTLVVNLHSSTFGNLSVIASRRSNFTFDLAENGSKTIHLRINKLPIIDGAYSFNVSLYGKERANLLDQKSALGSFKILNPNEKTRSLKGVLLLDHQWEISDRD